MADSGTVGGLHRGYRAVFDLHAPLSEDELKELTFMVPAET
jgi:hypothetical protein